MAADTKTTPKNSVSEIFKSMEYGPAPEADNVVKAWLNDHDNGEFGLFIDGKWVKPDGRKTYQTKNPATGEPLATTIQGEQEDVDLAVSSAKKAYETWSKTPNHVRARHLYSIARHIQKHMRLFSVVEAMDNGKTFRETRDADIPIVVRHFYHHAGWAQLMDTEMRGWKSVGVIGGIVPWNFPLMLLTWKIAPALAMGNTVVLKPATYTRLSALLLAEVCAEAGLPPGVFNVITGSGAMGSKLADHPDVDKVAFTGSTGVGQTLRRLTAGSGKKLSLELGGKSPVVVFETADLDSTVEGVVDAIWFNQGQVCSAGSRLLVQEGIHDKLVAKLKERLTHFRVGDSLDKTVDMGAIVDESQRKSIEEYVESARQEGAEIFQISPIPKKGCFYPPTIITNVQTVSRVVVEEIFGPVLVVLPFRTAKEAIALSNNTIYGLGGSVWTENIPLALEAALSIKAGTVWINCHNLFDSAAGFGGYKQSGYGRDGGKEGLFEYVRPSWEKRPRPEPVQLDLKAFGQMVQARPTIGNNQKNEISADGNVPGIDRTFKMYYGGKQARPDAPYSRPVVSPNGTVIAHVGEGNRKDVRNAVEAAHAAAAGWGKRAAHNRAQIVYYMAENLELRRDEVANRIHQMTGRSMDDCRTEVDLSVQRLFHWGAYCDKYGGSVQETTLYGCTVKVHEPMGVIGIACPDDYPLLGFVSLFAPAVIRGNVIVIVPSEKYPLSALDLYQVFDTSDLPGGVVNILTGDRNHLAKYLTEHQDIQSMWYFGTAEGSKFVEYMSAENVKRTWVNYGLARDWTDPEQGQGEEFLYQSIQCKNIWIPMGDIFAN
ncbi:aldehyde dehydrogenase family 16 member A1-like [Mytilus californianus]|uniref:aldehyde dehydrogenase family 16 member A1-like n=1 Tax=Mytilus californianus TaxID=6549 RepID=UPI002245E700|nr:aldehyde dehydrogenase family 16 member A1-like [Mytilus californianus]